MSLVELSAEWERIETLSAITLENRSGVATSKERLEALRQVQERVLAGRQNGAWGAIAARDLSRMEFDVLACAIAPEISPRVAWMFRSMNGRDNDPYPTLHFLQELLSLAPEDIPTLFDAVGEIGNLKSLKLVRTEGHGPFASVQPGAGVTGRLINITEKQTPPPGTTPVDIQAHWEDLVLPEAQVAMLREFLSYLTCRNIVVDQWGAKSFGGPIALFSGPSGTGKTFAASVLANELGWPLFRVDLGRLVSKYIGETEKNLNALFDAAHDVPMILQFDEADSLFSSRGEVKEARDRYANLEVSHLLARIETHSGPCILTTNLRDQMDAAFARRFQVVIDFPRPDREARKHLWKKLLPPRAPLDEGVDFDLIAEAVALSGGSIRNAALHSAVLAASSGASISLKIIARAAWRELGKEGRPVALNEIGALSQFLEAKAS